MADRDGRGLIVLHVEAERYPPEAMALLRDVGEVHPASPETQAAFTQLLADAPYDAVFVRLGLSVTSRELDAAPKLRFVVTPTTGLDHIDVDAANARGVTVVSLRGETEFLRTVSSTAEHAWALLLALKRNLVAAIAEVQAGVWAPAAFACGELAGETLGIVGFGRLGQMVAGYGRAFGMRIVATDRDPEKIRAAGVDALDPDELLRVADVVSLHLPLASDTQGWLTRERLATMRPTALLIDTARGELVDEDALLDALRRGAIAGAGLDVLAGDARWDGTVPEGHPLVAHAATHPNLVITPHIGGAGVRAVPRARLHVAERFVDAVRATAGGVRA